MIQIDILKVLDIQRSDITTGLLYKLQGNCTYQDCDEVEDMYSITVEERMGSQLDEYEQRELSEILQLWDINVCSYFRVINH